MNTKGRITTVALAGVAVVAMVLVLFASPVNAQATSYGTQVKYGDNDFIPTLLANPGVAPNLKHVSLGVAADFTDDGYYFGTLAGGAAVATYDVRIVAVLGKTQGSLVLDGDTTERTFGATSAAQAFRFGDVNNNGRYDSGDSVYIVSNPAATANCPGGAGAGLCTAANVAGDGDDQFTIRLTAAGGKAAGSIVIAGDSDWTSYSTSAGALGASVLAYWDGDLSATFTPGDRLYVTSGALPANGAVPLYSVRIVGDSGQFGSQVVLGNADFRPLLVTGLPIGIANAQNGEFSVYRRDFGITGDVSDDCWYMETSGGITLGAVPGDDTGAINSNDLRLTACLGKAAGTLVGDADSTEIGAVVAANTFAYIAGATEDDEIEVKFGDANSNGRYDIGDCAYLSTNVGAAGIAATTGAAVTIRLTGCSGKAAGTAVFSGDPDFNAYQANAPLVGGVANGMTLMAFDADLSATASPGATTVSTPDRVYLAQGAGVATNSLVPLASVRLYGGTFGSQVLFGDSDFIPTLGASTAIAGVGEVGSRNYGVATDPLDDGFYMDFDVGADVDIYEVRLTAVLGKTAGSIVQAADTAEIGAYSAATPGTLRVCFADPNGNSRYDLGDYVYITTAAAALPASTAAATYSIRLTMAGSYAAGTLVKTGETDQQSYNAACTTTAAGYAIFDADLSGAGFTPGDRLYVTPTGNGAGALVPLFSVRLVGDFSTGGGGGTTGVPTSPTSGTSPVSPTSPTSGTSPVSPTSGTSPTSPTGATSPTTTRPTTKTPGFELVAVVAGLSVAILALRRK